MKEKLLLLLLLFTFSIGETSGQITDVKFDNPKEVVIQSWKKGDETIRDQQIRVVLSSTNQEYQQEIIGNSGKRYLLKIYYNPYSDLDLDHWEVNLYEILSKPDEAKNNLSSRLLTLEPDEPGKHVFWKEDFAGILYVEEKPLAISENNEPLYGEGLGFYYYKTVRKINIENFCMVIKLGDFKFNNKDKNKFDSFEILINFKNTCSEKK